MTASSTDPIAQAAAAWFARLRDDDEPDWEAFQGWLEADPAHRLAFEQVETLWLDLEDAAAQTLLVEGAAKDGAGAPLGATVTPLRPRAARPTGWLLAGGAIAASVAALLLVPPWLSPAATDYQTAKGEIRIVALADGSRLTLGADTHLSVTIGPSRRSVVLKDGEASFDVAHLPQRPFLVALGDQEVRVIGTEFNISRHQGQTAVTVRRGVVAVAQAGGGEVRLTKGQQVLHTEGSTVQDVRRADPEAVFAWRSGRLIYDDAPLALVVADFNRYGDRPIRIDPSAAGVRVNGVFFVDKPQAMAERLAKFNGMIAEIGSVEIVLKRK